MQAGDDARRQDVRRGENGGVIRTLGKFPAQRRALFDADFQPVLQKAKSEGKETIVLGVEPGFSTALKNTADVVIMVGATE